MSTKCPLTKFVLNKGVDNEFFIKIKKNKSTMAIVINPADTFTARLFNIDTGDLLSTISLGSGIEVEDASNGVIKLTYIKELIDTLDSDRGDKVDRYYLKATYRLAIECDTVDNGKFIANLNEVFVR